MSETFLTALTEHWSLCLEAQHTEYLQGRGASEAQIDGMQIGTVASKALLTDAVSGDLKRFLKWSGNMKRILGQITFPLHDQLGGITGVLTKSAAVKDYSKFTLSGTAMTAFFFGVPMAMEAIWQTGVVWIVEGVFDWFPLQRVVPNTLACTFDTLSWKQADFVRRYANTAVLAFDMDKSGRDGVELARERLRGLPVLTVTYPYKDPGKFWEQQGEFAFRRHFLDESRRLGLL